MLKIQITKNKPRRIFAIAAMALLVGFYLFSQITLHTQGVQEGETIVYSVFMPLFIVLVLASILFDVSCDSPRLKLVLKIAIVVICIFAVMCASELLIGRFLWQLFLRNAAAFFMGFALMALIALFFYGITGSVPWSLRFMTICIMLYCYVNYFVTIFRGTPLVPVDILTVGTAMNVVSNYTFVWANELTESLLMFAGVFILAPRLKFPKLRKWPQRVVRLLALIIPVVFVGITVQRDFIYGAGFKASTWEQSRTQRSHGNVFNFYTNICEAYNVAPDDYSLEAVNEIAERYTSDSAAATGEEPDVILILGESWADLVPEGFAQASEDSLPFTRSLANQENSDVRTLITSTYGAGTSRSEFEVLTGAAQEYGMSQAPFQFSVTEPIPNIVESFKTLGYDTTAMHTGLAVSWDRDKAFPLMGFDEYYDMYNMKASSKDYLRAYIRDSVLYDKALATLDEGTAPQFLYLITIATHGGYTVEDYEETIEIESPFGFYPKTEQYLSLLKESDNDLKDFIAALEKREKPTLVLFFGDHLPYVDDDYNNTVLKSYDDWMWAHTTYYGVWANYELPQTVYDEYTSLSMNYLGPYLLEAAGLPLTGYQKFLRECSEEYSAISTAAFITPDGERVHVDEARETDLYKEQAILQYNFVSDRDNLPQDFYYLKE